MDKEMMKALEADGEKLRQLTGEDHGPVFLHDDNIGVCDCCGEKKPLSRCWAYGIETFACDECRDFYD